MVWCSIFGCSGKKSEGGFYRHFRFPKDKEKRMQWIHRCGRSDKVSDHGRVCEQHFSQKQYVRDLQSELLGIPSPPNRRQLKPEAVPDLHLPCKQGADIGQHSIKRPFSSKLSSYSDNSQPSDVWSMMEFLFQGITSMTDLKTGAEQITAERMEAVAQGDSAPATSSAHMSSTTSVDDTSNPMNNMEFKIDNNEVHGVDSPGVTDDVSKNDYIADASQNGNLVAECEYTDKQNKKRKRSRAVKVAIKAVKDEEKELGCDFDIFAKNIATCLKKLPLKRAVLLQKKIQNIIDEEFRKKPRHKNPVPSRRKRPRNRKQPAPSSSNTSSQSLMPKPICTPKLVNTEKSAPAAVNAKTLLTNPETNLNDCCQESFHSRNQTSSGEERLSRLKGSKIKQNFVDNGDSSNDKTERQNNRTTESDGLGGSSLVYIDVAEPCTEMQGSLCDSDKACVEYEEEKYIKDELCEEYILTESNACIDYEERKYFKDEIPEEFIETEDWDTQELVRVKQDPHDFKDQYESEGTLCIEVKQEPGD